MGKIKITLQDLFNIPTAVIYNPDRFAPVSKIVIDSRKVKSGSLFVALKGEKHDGHDYIFEAINKGAKAILINKNKLKLFSKLDLPIITVQNTTNAYGDLGRVWRKKLKSKVISITGSNGKTTTKEIIATLLSEKFNVVKSEANNNNHIGVPLTILSANEKCSALVLEQGTNHFGEIEYSTNISLPDISLITNIGNSHLEFLKNKEGVYKEKSALLDLTEIHGGKVFLNMDDPIINKKSKNYWNKITYGFKGKVDVTGKVGRITKEGKPQLKIKYNKLPLQLGKGSASFTVTLPIYGYSNAKNFLAAVSVALYLGLSKKQILSGTNKLKPVHGRMDVKIYEEAVVIDDTYNSNPDSVKSAIDVVYDINLFQKKIFVIGDMLELGKNSAAFHKELARYFHDSTNTLVLTCGELTKHINRSLSSRKTRSIHFYLREALGLYLKYESIENSVILVKGSRGMKMEEFVNILEKRFE